jgi:hypothetical protein
MGGVMVASSWRDGLWNAWKIGMARPSDWVEADDDDDEEEEEEEEEVVVVVVVVIGWRRPWV